MKRALIALAAVVVLTPALCAQSQPDLQVPPTEYYPLKVGTTWEYKSGEKTTIISTVEKIEKVGDDNCARIVTKIKDDKDNKTRTEHVTVRKDDGIYRVAYQDSRLDPALCFLKLPATGTWKIDAKMLNVGLKGDGTVAEKTVKIKFDGVDRDALVCTTTLQADNKSTIKVTYYFVKDIGIVKQEVDFNNNQVVQELVKFTPGK